MQGYLAVDIGASGGRHILGWLEEGRVCTKEIYRFENGMTEKDGHLVWDLEKLVHHVMEGLKACYRGGYAPVSVGIDTWGVDYVLLDAAGKPLGDAVAYRDSRTDGMDVLLEKTLPFQRMYQLTGIAKQPFNTVYQMMAVLEEHPEDRERATDFLLMPEYLSYCLCGKKAHEWTNLSTTALMDAQRRTWSREVRRAAGLPDSWFRTPIVEPGTYLGRLRPEIAREVGFDAEVILPATHDTGSAFMAIPAQDDQAVFLSSGTWSLLGVELSAPLTGEKSRLSGFTNEGGWGGTIRHLRNIMGMWMLQSIRQEMGKTHSFSEMADMADQSDYGAYVDVTDNRFLAPKSMTEEVRSALREQGAPEPDDIGAILRAVTMGLAVGYKKSIEDMAKQTGKTFTSINIVGGGCQNQTLNRMTARQTGLPVFAGPAEGTALGNLGAQMICSGALTDLAAFRAAVKKSVKMTVCLPEG